jgi:hypothetical protein
MDVGCSACLVGENNIADTPHCAWTTSGFFEGIPSSVSFESFSMTSYEIASLLKQIRPVSAEL